MKSRLFSFYFGSVAEGERLQIERELLVDPAMLLDYLDLKRQLEGAALVPALPSPVLWNRLSSKFKTSKRARVSIAVGLTLALTASLVFMFLILQRSEPPKKMVESGVLFDSGHEQFGLSNVL